MKFLKSLRRPYSSLSHVFELSESNFATHNCPMPATSTTLTREQGLDLYTSMVNIRRIETASDQVLFMF